MSNNDIIQDFCDLCREYGLPSDPGDVEHFNWTLFFIFKEKRNGTPWMATETIGDLSSVADIARLLTQVMEGDITVQGRVRPIPYTNQETLRLLKESLVGILKRRVFRYGNKLVLSLSQTSATIVSENANGPEDGFTFDELDSIIQAVAHLNKTAKKYQGKRTKGADTHTHTKDISPVVKAALDALKDCGLNTMAKYNFVADFLFRAGFLDFKGDTWLDDYRNKCFDNKDKYDIIHGYL